MKSRHGKPSAAGQLYRNRQKPGQLERRAARILPRLLRWGLDLETAAAVAHNGAVASVILGTGANRALKKLSLEQLAAYGVRWMEVPSEGSRSKDMAPCVFAEEE